MFSLIELGCVIIKQDYLEPALLDIGQSGCDSLPGSTRSHRLSGSCFHSIDHLTRAKAGRQQFSSLISHYSKFKQQI